MNIQKLNAFKKASGLTNAKIAEITGITLSNIDKITSGNNTNPKLDTIQAICKAIGCTVDDLDDAPVNISKNNFTSNNNTETLSEKAFSIFEKKQIQKYRKLDDHGKRMVDFTLNEEYERCMSAIEQQQEETPVIDIRNSVYKVSAGTGYQLDIEEWETIEIPDTYENRQADFTLTISGNSMEPVYHDGDIVLVKHQQQIELGEIGIFIINDEGFIKKYGGDRLISLNDDYKDIFFSENDYIKCCGKVIGRV